MARLLIVSEMRSPGLLRTRLSGLTGGAIAQNLKGNKSLKPAHLGWFWANFLANLRFCCLSQHRLLYSTTPQASFRTCGGPHE